MLVMYLCIMGIDVGHVLGVSMLIFYLCARCIEVALCICV
jgi:hypothetical protein